MSTATGTVEITYSKKNLPAMTGSQEASKTTKALRIVLGNLPEIDELKRLKKRFELNKSSRYYKSKYDYQLTKIQTTLLRSVNENRKKSS